MKKAKRPLGSREDERAKRVLTDHQQMREEVGNLFDGVGFSDPLTHARFEELNNDLCARSMGPIVTVMLDAQLQKSEIAEIILVGGTTRIPKVQKMLKDSFDGKEPIKGDLDETIARDAAVVGGIWSDTSLNPYGTISTFPSSYGLLISKLPD